jgi:hypothetical protein
VAVGRSAVLVSVVVLILAGAGPDAAQVPGAAGIWTEAPEYLGLFAPPGLRRGAYRAYVARAALSDILDRLADDPRLLRPPGAWIPRPLLPADAFGQTGPYNRSKLARLYGARRPLVARGPAGSEGVPLESWTLVSPYPDPALARLEAGTLLIVLSLSHPRSSAP